MEEIRTAFTYGTVVVRAKMSRAIPVPPGRRSGCWARHASIRSAPFTWLSGSSSIAAGYYCPWSSDSSDSSEIDIAEGDTGNPSTVRENVYNRSSGINDSLRVADDQRLQRQLPHL